MVLASSAQQTLKEIKEQLQEITAEIRWLEYEVSDLTTSYLLNQAINSKQNEVALPETHLSEIALESSLRSVSALNQLLKLQLKNRERIELVLEYERRMIEKKIDSSNFKEDKRRNILAKLERCLGNEEDTDYLSGSPQLQKASINDITDIRLFQLHEVLYKILETSNSSDEKEKINELINRLYDVDHGLEKRRKKTEKISRIDKIREDVEDEGLQKIKQDFEPKD